LQAEEKNELLGVKIIAYFLRLCVQPLQARASQRWSFSGLKDKSRVSDQELPEEIFEKQVWSLMKLAKKHRIPVVLAKPYDTRNPPP
jgi:hypothetical protein